MMLMRWVASGNSSPLPVHGPEGVEAVIAGFNAAHAANNGYRTAHHGATVTPPQPAGAVPPPLPVPTAPTIRYRADGGTITAFPPDPRQRKSLVTGTQEPDVTAPGDPVPRTKK